MMITDLRKRPVETRRAASLAAALALGFRPFFLLAGLFATLIIPVWLLVYAGLVQLPTGVPASAWHAHEMLFGFTGAVLAGFLLTAARNWTTLPTASGPSLAALAVLWLSGRVAMALEGAISHLLAAAVDLAFLPTLAASLAYPIVKAKNTRNLGFVGLLSLLFLANLLFHAGGPLWRSRALRLAIELVLMIIVLMGGRVIPSFTEGALKVRATRWRWVEWGSLGSVGLVAVLELVPDGGRMGGVASIVAGVINGVRLLGWRSAATRAHPILWVLHLGYAWLAIGLVLHGLAAVVTGWPESATMHALTVGAIGMLTLGMMSRVSLGHTGRMLIVARPIAVAFGLLLLSAVVRSVAPLVFPGGYLAELIVSGTLWTVAFGLFTAIYFPLLTTPRVDGKPG